MKRLFTIVAVTLFVFPIYSQTREMEDKSLEQRFLSKELDQLQYKTLVKSWQALLKEYPYPNLPYNESTQQVEFETVYELPGVPQEIIYKRVKEWAAISFGRLSAVLHYEDFETGKIILKGSFKVPYIDFYKGFWGAERKTINSSTCNFTSIITINSGKIKIQNLGLDFEYTSYSYSTYVSEITTNRDLNEHFPISSYPEEYWKEYLQILDTTQERIKKLNSSLKAHILNYSEDYNF
jgi:hypothetical protein